MLACILSSSGPPHTVYLCDLHPQSYVKCRASPAPPLLHQTSQVIFALCNNIHIHIQQRERMLASFLPVNRKLLATVLIHCESHVFILPVQPIKETCSFSHSCKGQPKLPAKQGDLGAKGHILLDIIVAVHRQLFSKFLIPLTAT